MIKRKCTIFPVRVQVTRRMSDYLPPDEKWFSVCPIYEGVDRPNVGGWVVAEKHVKRLTVAIMAGAACPATEILTDVNGKTYVDFTHVVSARHINAELKRIGF